jgi:S1-C subfamily serine protease
MRINLNRFLIVILTSMMLATSVSGQEPAPVETTLVQLTSPAATTPQDKTTQRKTVRRTTPPVAKVTVIPSQAQIAPQVVTIVHRLSGLKMLRLLVRQAGERGTVATIDPLSMKDDAHASVFAGWTMDDGKTITARLPQAAAEIDFLRLPADQDTIKDDLFATEATTARAARPDLTVITGDGQRLAARYVGLDGQTGLSVLQVIGLTAPPPLSAVGENLVEGQLVQLFAPERTTPAGEATPGTTYVQVGEIQAKVSTVARSRSGKLERLLVSSDKLSPVIIGGIACDESGNTIGIVEAVVGNYARIVPAENVRAATRRVLERQASVPRPVLGVRGESVELAGRAAFLAYGWREDQLNQLFANHIGILLTSVMPETPAALAKLRPGDVIVRVNQGDVKSAEEFSSLLSQVGSGEQVQFFVRRPDSSAPLPVDVTLGSSFEPIFKWPFDVPLTTAMGGLESLGIETVGLTPKAASSLGARHGLLVVFVRPATAAARGGIREGDLIESIDGRALRSGAWAFTFLGRQRKHVLSVIRDREKKQVVLESVE